ncbi:PHB depolymerase family esterase, partial [Streptomyces bryophytorum]
MPPTRAPGGGSTAGTRHGSGRKRLAALLTALLATVASILTAVTLSAQSAAAASLTEVTNFGSNPGNLRMYEYVPNSVKPNPAILVAVHYCTGTGPAFYSGTEFHTLADQYGFIVIYPDANVSGQCFDVSSAGALTHNGSSDPASIASMVSYVEQHNSADASRVYVTGASSGAMMTDVLLGDYPDIFKAGAAFMGVPFACFATSDGSGWNSACANGQISHTPQEWGDLVRGAYPGYSGPRPRVQLWHGTADTTLNYNNFGEEIKQWTNVLGVSQTPVLTDSPQSGWTHTRYGTNSAQAPVEAFSISGVGHSLPTNGMAARAITFFGLDGSGSTSGGTSTGTST